MMQLDIAKTLNELDEEHAALTHTRRAAALRTRHIGDSGRIDEARTLRRELTQAHIRAAATSASEQRGRPAGRTLP